MQKLHKFANPDCTSHPIHAIFFEDIGKYRFLSVIFQNPNSAMDDVHVYDDAGHRGGYTYKSSNKTEAVTSFNEQQKYMTLSGQQGEPSEYQELQLCSYKDTREAVDTCNIGSSDFYGQKDELKKMKRCLCVLSFLVVVLFLITVSSLGLAAYGSTPSSQIQEASAEGIIKTTDSEFSNHDFTLFKEQLTQEAIQIWENISSLRNTVNQEAGSQRTFINNLESRLNGINSQVSTLTPLRTSVTSLESQLRMTNMMISSLQLSMRSQPSMQYI